MPHTFFKIPAPLTLPQFGGAVVSLIPARSSTEGREMLARLTGALGFTEGVELCTLPVAGDVSAAADLRKHAALRHVIVYGLNPGQIGANWQVAPYVWLRDEKLAWCFAERPEEIAVDQDKKKRLWSAIKHLKTN